MILNKHMNVFKRASWYVISGTHTRARARTRKHFPIAPVRISILFADVLFYNGKTKLLTHSTLRPVSRAKAVVAAGSCRTYTPAQRRLYRMLHAAPHVKPVQYDTTRVCSHDIIIHSRGEVNVAATAAPSSAPFPRPFV